MDNVAGDVESFLEVEAGDDGEDGDVVLDG